MATLSFPAVVTVNGNVPCYIYGDDFEKRYGSVSNEESVVIIDSGTIESTGENVFQLGWSMDTGYTTNFWLRESEIINADCHLREANDMDLDDIGVLEAYPSDTKARAKHKGLKILYGPSKIFYSAGRVNPNRPLNVIATYPGYFLVQKEVDQNDPNMIATRGFVSIADVELESYLKETNDMIEPGIQEEPAMDLEPVKTKEEMKEVIETPIEPAPVPVKEKVQEPKKEETHAPHNEINYNECTLFSILTDTEDRVNKLTAFMNGETRFGKIDGIVSYVAPGNEKGFENLKIRGYVNIPEDYESHGYILVKESDTMKMKKVILGCGFRPTIHELG